MNTPPIINRLTACCETGDDEQMLTIINELAKHQEKRDKSACLLLEALELRPNYGPFLEPGEWREEVTSCLWQLYDTEKIRTALLTLEEPVARRMEALLSELFDQPIVIINPVLENGVSFEKNLPLASESLEAILAACKNYEADPGDIEQQLQDIENLESSISALECSLNNHDQRHELKCIATQLRDLLDNPETNVWQDLRGHL